MKARLIYDEGDPRVLPTPTGYLIDCTIQSPPPDANRGVWIEMTTKEANDLQHRLAYLIWADFHKKEV